MLNPFFQQGSKTEQSLVQSLINEQLKIYGVEVYYLPRIYATKTTAIKEVIESKFTNAYPIEAYVDSYDGYGGLGTLMTKFGIQDQDDLTIILSKERYESYISPLIKNIPNIELSTRPKEGDLIYFPLGDRLFEIKFVEHEKPFYQLQKNYVYELRCELFRSEDEVLDTNVESIDDNLLDQGYIQSLTLVGSASTATAFTGFLRSHGLRKITLTDRGDNFTSAPRVAFSSAPTAGLTAVGIATLITGLIDCVGSTNEKKVQGVEIINPGIGYTVAPGISFIGGGGSGVAATTIIAERTVGFVTVSDSGGGYVTAPLVTFTPPKHVGAAATAVLDTPVVGNGVSIVSAPISIGASAYLFPGGTTGGVFYKTAPTVTFAEPTGSSDTATAVATISDFETTGGNVATLSITDGGRFYTSAPTVSIAAPDVSIAAATISIAGTSLNPSTLAFSTTGRAYTSAPTVLIGLGTGTDSPHQTAVGVATINSITGVVTGLSFDVTDPWAVGSGATIGIGYTVNPTISFSSPSPVTATATVTVSAAGTVNSISIGNSGFGYYGSAPTVTIAASAGINTEFIATGIATMRFDSIKTVGTISTESNLITGISTVGVIVGDRVRLTFHHNDPVVANNFISTTTHVSSIGVGSISLSENSTNVGIATTSFEFGIDQCGIVTGIIITNGGGGYLTPPTVTISNNPSEKNYVDLIAGVHTARGTSVINSAGIVTSIRLTDSGAKYVITPTITISDPNLVSTGDFIFNETVTGSISSTTGVVNTWDSSTGVLEIKVVTGSFEVGETIVGSESGASRQLRIINTDDVVTPYADNDIFESEADSILDFSETNPFGTP